MTKWLPGRFLLMLFDLLSVACYLAAVYGVGNLSLQPKKSRWEENKPVEQARAASLLTNSSKLTVYDNIVAHLLPVESTVSLLCGSPSITAV